jgi:hypothetical protein
MQEFGGYMALRRFATGDFDTEVVPYLVRSRWDREFESVFLQRRVRKL